MDATLNVTPEQLYSAPDVWADPYPAYRQWRDRSPVRAELPVRFPDGSEEHVRVWMLLKYDHVHAALRDPDTFSSAGPLQGKLLERLVLIHEDGARHRRTRRLVAGAFTPARIAALAPTIARIADSLLDGIGEEEVDIVGSYAVPLPLTVMAQMLGIPDADVERFKRWCDVILGAMTAPAEERADSLDQFRAYVERMARERRGQGGSDLISALADAAAAGERLEDAEIVGFGFLLLFAGNETVTDLLSNLLNILVDRPDLLRQLAADRSFVERVIEETVRYESSVPRLLRTTTRDVAIGGVRIPQGEHVAVFFGAANRDPAAFPDPDEFRPDRDLRHHVGFGAGIHHCLGAPLARTQARITVNAFLDRFASIERGTAPVVRRRGPNIVFDFQRLPLRLTAR